MVLKVVFFFSLHCVGVDGCMVSVVSDAYYTCAAGTSFCAVCAVLLRRLGRVYVVDGNPFVAETGSGVLRAGFCR